MNLHKMLAEIISTIHLPGTFWTFVSVLLLVLGSDMTREVACGGSAGKIFGAVIISASLDDRRVRT